MVNFTYLLSSCTSNVWRYAEIAGATEMAIVPPPRREPHLWKERTKGLGFRV